MNTLNLLRSISLPPHPTGDIYKKQMRSYMTLVHCQAPASTLPARRAFTKPRLEGCAAAVCAPLLAQWTGTTQRGTTQSCASWLCQDSSHCCEQRREWPAETQREASPPAAPANCSNSTTPRLPPASLSRFVTSSNIFLCGSSTLLTHSTSMSWFQPGFHTSSYNSS